MKKSDLKINEIFYSVQGEGANTGMAAVFVRFSGCNLTCPFCDTDHREYTEMSVQELKSEVEKYPCKQIIWTGGEPTLQLTDEILSCFESYYHCIETNGTHEVPERIHYVSCSPKVPADRLRLIFKTPRKNSSHGRCLDEFRFPVRQGDKLPDIDTLPTAVRYYISPIDVNRENLEYCLALIAKNPRWRLSVQLHKLLHIK